MFVKCHVCKLRMCIVGGMETTVQGEHLDDIFSQVLSHDVMASDMPLTFTGMYLCIQTALPNSYTIKWVIKYSRIKIKNFKKIKKET